MSVFRKAERRKAWLKVGVAGPSGSGKTYSSLLIAAGLGERIALADSENGSGSLYAGAAGMPEFDVVDINPPFTVEKYAAALKAAVDAKYDVLVIDSITHEWAGEGGLIDQKEALDSRGGQQNKFANWAPVTRLHEKFKAAILQSPIHVVATMRSKQEYVQTDDKKVKKLGMAPIQREGMEYEFGVVFDMAMDHTALASKDRTSLFDQKIFTPTIETGRTLKAWLNLAAGKLPTKKPTISPEAAEERAKACGFESYEQQKNAVRGLWAVLGEAKVDEDALKELMRTSYSKESTYDLLRAEISDLRTFYALRQPRAEALDPQSAQP